MNWGLEVGPKTDGFMALARSSPSVDFVCHRVRRERESQTERKGGRERERGKQRLKFYTATFEKGFAIQPPCPEFTTGAFF